MTPWILICLIGVVNGFNYISQGAGCGQTFNNTNPVAIVLGTPSRNGGVCSMWSGNSCCSSTTLQSISNGSIWGKNWNACQAVSSQCQAYMELHACLTHCDVNAGKFSSEDKCTIHTNSTTLPFNNLPLKDSECSSMFAACSADLFCINRVTNNFLDVCAVGGCKPLSSYFPGGGADMCSKMWGAGSIIVISDPTISSLSMNITTSPNPNDAVFQTKPFSRPCSPSKYETCTIQSPSSFALSQPSTDPFYYCQAWQDNACCSATTTSTLANLFNFQYMSNFISMTDSCSTAGNPPISSTCENWFIQRSCLSQCDVTTSPYRKFEGCSPSNTWQMIGYPINSNDCNSWYTACANDFFAMPVNGNYLDWTNTTICLPLSSIYLSGGAQMCNTMFGSAFVADTLPNSYTLNPVGATQGLVNSNELVTSVNSFPVVCSVNEGEICAIHDPQTEIFASPITVPVSNCGAWKDNACCSASTVNNFGDLSTLYGPSYSWHRCGTLSAACESWFVAEACFFECDVNGSKYRKWKNCSPNTLWEMQGLPLRASDCDGWYDACYNDVLGIPVGGSFYDWGPTSTCIPLNQIYSNGQQLCELMWGQAFLYETNETIAYTLKPEGALMGLPNSNDYVDNNVNYPSICSVKQGELCRPAGNGLPDLLSISSNIQFTYCKAWQDNSCCDATMTSSLSNLFNYNYMSNFQANVNSCGTLSDACSAFFVDQACFYQCDVNAAPYKRQQLCNVANDWKLFGLPLRSIDCDSWYNACYNDKFAMPVNGSFSNWSSNSQCLTMGQIYASSQIMCETIFQNAFVYEVSMNDSFTIRPGGHLEGLPNVNDYIVPSTSFPAVCSPNQGATCHVQTADSLIISMVASGSFNYCQAWRDNACCTPTSTQSVNSLFSNNQYLIGFNTNMNVCGPLSDACLNFFVAMSCFYECDVNAGNYLKYEQCGLQANSWELHGLPLKASDIDNWYIACSADMFPIPVSGSYSNFEGNLSNSTCQPVSTLYTSGQNFVESFFSGAFVYDQTPSALTIIPDGALAGRGNVNDFVGVKTSLANCQGSAMFRLDCTMSLAGVSSSLPEYLQQDGVNRAIANTLQLDISAVSLSNGLVVGSGVTDITTHSFSVSVSIYFSDQKSATNGQNSLQAINGAGQTNFLQTLAGVTIVTQNVKVSSINLVQISSGQPSSGSKLTTGAIVGISISIVVLLIILVYLLLKWSAIKSIFKGSSIVASDKKILNNASGFGASGVQMEKVDSERPSERSTTI